LVTNEGKEEHYARVIGRNPTARPSVQVTMKAASQHFSTRASFKPVWPILSIWAPRKCRKS